MARMFYYEKIPIRTVHTVPPEGVSIHDFFAANVIEFICFLVKRHRKCVAE